MSQTLFQGRVDPVDIQDEIQRSYLDYAMSVIVGRALPQVEDGLKPVQRRILYSMFETGLRPDRPFRKCAAAVGDVMKKYHPHGDQPIYDALVRMGQDFSLRAPLIDKKGNFGSIDGDEPAAMRYCVAGDTLVRRGGGGTVRIDGLAPDAAPESDSEIDAKLVGRLGDPVAADRLFHSGVHPTLRITTREGFSLVATENHPVLCIEPVLGVPMLLWKLASEVRPGDRVALLRRPVEEWEPLTKREEQLAVLAGAFLAEGFVSPSRAGFNNVDLEYFDRVVAAYDAVVGGARYLSHRTIASGSSLHELDVHNLGALLESPLAEMAGQRSTRKRVPEFLWRGGPAFKATFLRALFEGDGSSSLLPRGTIQVSYSTRSPQLASGVQQLLLELGVVSRLSRNRRGEIKVVLTNRRDARLFARDVGFLGRKQRKLLRELEGVPATSTALSSDHVPYVAAYVREDGASDCADRAWLRKHNVDRVERWERHGDEISSHITNPEVLAVIEPLVDGRYYFAELAAVEAAGDRPVYSVRVDSADHAFVTNGFISHNTEARLSQLAMEMLREIDQETVDFIPNYDGYEQEPVLLPARFPNLLVNGAGGIAVGMATNIPPHNLGEVVDGVIAAIDNPDITPGELTALIKGPDFPTGALILGRQGIRDAFETGRGSIKMRGVTEIEENNRGRQQIVITEVPYQVNPATLLTKVAQLREDKKVPEVAPDPRNGKPTIRNESKDDLRLVIELRPGANPHVLLNKLYKHTQLQDTFGVIMLALVGGVPRVLNLAEMVGYYIDHQVDVITRRTRYQLRRAEERDHIVLGLLIALEHIDEVIRIIRGAQDADEARTKLMQRFELSEIQANHILDMPLRRLTRLARAELEQEHQELLERIAYLRGLLDDPVKVRGVLKEELLDVKERFANRRRTRIVADEGEMSMEDLVAEEDVVITVSRAGYVKRQPVEAYRRQGRGGRGVIGTNLKEEDVISHVFTTTTHHWLLFFTSSGKVYRVKVHEIPEGSRTARGIYAANLAGVVVSADERVQAVIDLKQYDEERYLVFATRRGIVKRTRLAEYDSSRTTGLVAINLKPGDELMGVLLTDGTADLMLVSRKAMAVRFAESSVRVVGRAAAGVIGMRLADDDEVLALASTASGEELISVTENGYGKRTALTQEQFRTKGRGIKGVTAHTVTKRTGGLAGAFVGSKDQDLFVINSDGIVIRVPASQIRRVGRLSQGVRTMRVEPGAKVVAIAPVVTQNGEE